MPASLKTGVAEIDAAQAEVRKALDKFLKMPVYANEQALMGAITAYPQAFNKAFERPTNNGN